MVGSGQELCKWDSQWLGVGRAVFGGSRPAVGNCLDMIGCGERIIE